MRDPGERRGRRLIAAGVGVSLLLVGPNPSAASGGIDDLRATIERYQVAADAAPCDLDWAVLGGIAGFVSDHGRVFQPVDPNTPETMRTWLGELMAHNVSPDPVAPSVPIRGSRLDGTEGRLLIRDTDGGLIDGDAELDRAVGPFQFIPQTWAAWATDADGDGVADPDDLDDAAGAAAAFLCDLGADRELGRALTGWFGTDTFNGAVRAEVAAVRDADRRLQASSPSAVLAGPTARVELADVGGILVRIDIADDVAAMLVAATIDGVRLQGSGWRSHERQIELRAQNCADVWETPPSQCSPPTAIPGTSGHEVGEAIDFFVLDDGVRRAIRRDDPQFAWLGAHAAEYGLFNLPSEPWHWSTTGG